MFGWTGKILYIDLTNKKIKTEDTSKYIDWIGGRGINQLLLFNILKDKKIQPLEPENPLIFGAGPFVGTLAPSSCRLSIDFQNVMNNGIGSGNCGGHFAAEMKYAGYDHIVISGKSEYPIYIFIKDDKVYFRDARKIWGNNTWETENLIKKVERDNDIKTLSIGVAGENLVKFASIVADWGRSASYGGSGAVMGSKHLKCIAIKGTLSIKIANSKEIIKKVSELNNIINKSKVMQMHRIGGTLLGYLLPGEKRVHGVKNMSETFWDNEKIFKLSRYIFDSKYLVRRHSCFGCPIFCSSIFKVKGVYCEGFQANSWRSFASNLDLVDPEKVLYSHALTNLYGMDGDHTSSIIAWAIECYENGILNKNDTDGLELKWGNGENIIKMIEKIAHRNGIGDILAEGLYAASKIIGKDSFKFAMLSKKNALMEDAMRSHKAWSLGILLSNKGSGHLRGAPIPEEIQKYPFYISDKEYKFLDISNPTKYEGKAELVSWHQKYKGIIDSIGICALVSMWNDLSLYNLETISDFLNDITGVVISPSDLLTIGSKIYNLERAFNLLHAGFTREDDYPPSRLINVPIKKGKYKGERLEINQWNKLLDKYYTIQEWDVKNGIPTKEVLKKLGLEFVIEALKENNLFK